MKTYVVDTCLINKLVDGHVHADELPSDGLIIASHIQYDELSQTKDSKRRAELLKKFSEIIEEIVPTESFVFNESRFGGAKLGDGVAYDAIKAQLNSRNKRKPNNSKDALIAEIAAKNGYVLLTTDFDLYQVAELLGIGCIYWTSPRQNKL